MLYGTRCLSVVPNSEVVSYSGAVNALRLATGIAVGSLHLWWSVIRWMSAIGSIRYRRGTSDIHLVATYPTYIV